MNPAKRENSRKVVVSTVAQVLSLVITSAVGVVILKVLSNALGLIDYGVYATIVVFVNTFSLLTDLGLNSIAAREIAKRPQAASEIIGHNMGLRITMSIIMIPAIFGLSYVLYGHRSSTLHFGILFLSFYLFFDAVRSVALAYFVAQVRNEITAIISSLQQVLLLLLVCIVAFEKLGLYYYIFAILISNVVAMLIAVYLAQKEVRVHPKINLRAWRNILALSVSLGVIQLINMLYLKADSIILSVEKNAREVGIYSVAYSLILMFLALPGFIMTALIPTMATATNKQMRPILEKALHVIAVLAAIIAVGGFAVRNDIVPLVSSEAFRGAVVPFAILCLATVFSYLNNVFGFASVALNKHHKMIIVSAGALVLNVILNIILIPRFSVAGAAWATVVSELLAFTGVYLLFRRETGIAIGLRPVIKPALAAGVTILVLQLLSSIWKTNNHFIGLLVHGFLAVTAFSLSLLIIGGMPSEIHDFLHKFYSMVRRPNRPRA